MLVLQHRKLLAEQAGVSPAEIQPLKFGFKINWTSAATYVLASCKTPENMYLVVLRVECYVVNLTSGAADYGYFQPPPPGKAYWITANDAGTSGQEVFTNIDAPTHILLDTDQFFLFPSKRNANLLGNLDVSPDGDTRAVRTTVYGYLVDSVVAGALGADDFISLVS
jgi:hypothetical protein